MVSSIGDKLGLNRQVRRLTSRVRGSKARVALPNCPDFIRACFSTVSFCTSRKLPGYFLKYPDKTTDSKIWRLRESISAHHSTMGWPNILSKRTESGNQQGEVWWRPSVASSPQMRLMEDYKRMCYLQWMQLPQVTQTTILVSVSASVSFIAGVSVGRMRVPWKRFLSINDVPPQYIGPAARNRKLFRGRCILVSDGDTFRFLHIPLLSISSRAIVQQSSEKLSDVTLPIRVCTIDTPETAKFGKPGQPYSNDAKELLSQMIENKMVRCRFLHKDQYGRLVAEVRFYPYWPWIPWYYRSVDEIMLQKGLAEVYVGSGAVYGYRGKDYYLQLQRIAQQKQLGQWSLQNQTTYESASQYKARTKS